MGVCLYGTWQLFEKMTQTTMELHMNDKFGEEVKQTVPLFSEKVWNNKIDQSSYKSYQKRWNYIKLALFSTFCMTI